MFSFTKRKHSTRLKAIATTIALVACFARVRAAETSAPGIRVQLRQQKHLTLHVTLTSGAKTEVTISRGWLPWATFHSMVIVAALSVNSHCLEREIPVQDSFDSVSFEPNGSLSGDIDLDSLFPDIRRILTKLDVHLFWAYEAPEELHIPQWSGGWILVPKQVAQR
jgi:hypothetical protein